MPQPNQAQAALQQNQMARQALLATAPRMLKLLATIAQATPGGIEIRQKLFNVGLLTAIRLHVVATFNITATATITLRAPWNLFNYIKFTDFDQTDRINLDGYQAWLWQCIKQGRTASYPSQILQQYPGNGVTYTTLPVTPTAIASPATLEFDLYINIAYEPESDLRGAMLMQTDTGEAFIKLFVAPTLVGTDVETVYSAGTITTNAVANITINIYQDYLQPLAVGTGNQVPVPLVDISTVYELAGQIKTTSNLAANSEVLLSYPNVRTVVAQYLEYVNSGVYTPSDTDVSKIRILANGNTTVKEWLPKDLGMEARKYIGSDFPGNVYYLTHRRRPVETAQYGTFQVGFTPITVGGGNTYLRQAYESFYAKQALMQGFRQGS